MNSVAPWTQRDAASRSLRVHDCWLEHQRPLRRRTHSHVHAPMWSRRDQATLAFGQCHNRTTPIFQRTGVDTHPAWQCGGVPAGAGGHVNGGDGGPGVGGGGGLGGVGAGGGGGGCVTVKRVGGNDERSIRSLPLGPCTEQGTPTIGSSQMAAKGCSVWTCTACGSSPHGDPPVPPASACTLVGPRLLAPAASPAPAPGTEPAPAPAPWLVAPAPAPPSFLEPRATCWSLWRAARRTSTPGEAVASARGG